MARPIKTIKQGIIDSKNGYPSLAQIKFSEEGGSVAGLFNLEADTFSQCVNILEQLFDAYQTTNTEIAVSSVPVTDAWLYEKILEFQYSSDASNPQNIQLINLVPQYPVVDESLRIISRVSVTTVGNGIIKIKVATGEPPQALSSAQQTALSSYLDIISGAGPKCQVSSGDADRLAVYAQVYFDGQYISSIQTDVEAAINNYLATLPFNGTVEISDIIVTVKGVRGVNDFVMTNCYSRKSSDSFSTASPMARKYATVAGYIIEEDSTGHKFTDTITYTAE
jgi:hypothetical protein